MNAVNMRKRSNLFKIGSLVTFVFLLLMEGPKYDSNLIMVVILILFVFNSN